MPSLLRSSCPIQAVHTSQTPHPVQCRLGWIDPEQGSGDQRWELGKQQRNIHRSAKGMVVKLLLGMGVIMVGSSALASQASEAISPPLANKMSAPASPVNPSEFNPLELPLPAQVKGAPSAEQPVPDSPNEEAIQGDSEARLPSPNKGNIYAPIRLKSGSSVEDTLTTKDIPMGQGSFARDYVVTLKANDQVAIDLFSDSFDTVVTLMSENGNTLGENDDGPDGGTNSLLFMRITEDGDYVVRVRGFGQAKGGPFKLKLTRLKAVQ